MSRSYKKPIIKDNGVGHKLYRKAVRGSQKNYIRSNMDKLVNDEDFEIPDGKNIINDYDYCDYKIDYEYKISPSKYCSEDDIIEGRKKYKRK